MNIAYISRFASIDIKNWSGTEYYIAKAIGDMQGNKLDCIANLEERLNLSTRIKYQISNRLNKKYQINRAPYVTKQYAKQAEEQLKSLSSKIVFSPGTIPIAHLQCKQPKVYYTDATFASMINYYDWYKNVSKVSIKEALRLDQKAIDNSQLAIFSSDWAAQSAIKDYGASPQMVKVVPFGANIDIEPTLEDITKSLEDKTGDICRILFIGVDWDRKGGDTVLETVKKLNKDGLKTELHIVGLENLPSKITDLPFVINHGFISKSSAKGLLQIESIIKKSHFLFMPSKAEAYGLVYCEAAAYGLPSIATKTGGIPTIIKDGLNGQIFDLETDVIQYAEYINKMFCNKEGYNQLALSSFDQYQSRLNWRVAGATISGYLKELL